MLSESELYCLAYLTDEQIEDNGGIPSALLAAHREDDRATAQFADSYLIGMGMITLNLGEPPNWPSYQPQYDFDQEPVWLSLYG